MAKKKVNRVSNTRRPRIPDGHVRYEIIIPQFTVTRLYEHCERNSLDDANFVKKAIYNALPVHYAVDESFVFPFGKYQGETAGVVMQFDPEYIKWCVKSINGFTIHGDMIDHVDQHSMKEQTAADDVVGVRHGRPNMPLSWFVSRVGPNRKWKVNTAYDKFWAYEMSPWGQPIRWKMLGYVSNYDITAREG